MPSWRGPRGGRNILGGPKRTSAPWEPTAGERQDRDQFAAGNDRAVSMTVPLDPSEGNGYYPYPRLHPARPYRPGVRPVAARIDHNHVVQHTRRREDVRTDVRQT